MSVLLQDVRSGARTLRKNPAVTIVALVTLAVGIGANTAIFSLVDAILLKPLPYPHADRIVGLWERRPTGEPNSMTTLNYLDYASRSTAFDRVAAVTGCCGDVALTDGPVAEPMEVAHVSASYFDVFGATAALGRTFAEGEDRPGHDHVVVLSHRLWASRFGSDPTLVGRSIHLDGEPYTVVGVMAADSPFDRTFTSMWMPLPFGPERMNRVYHWLLGMSGAAVARLKPGVTLERARAELDAIAARLSTDYPATNKGWGVVMKPYAATLVGPELQRSLYLLLGAVALVLLIGCVNLANVLLAQGLAREREISVRMALGASRERVFRQFMTESLVLSLVGGALGIGVGYAATAMVKRVLAALPLNLSMLPYLIPGEAAIAVDRRVLLFSVALTVASGLAFGLAPAIGAIRRTEVSSIGLGSRTSTTAAHRRFRGALIVGEVALALTLVTSAGLLVRSLVNMQRADLGAEVANVLIAHLPFREHRFTDPGQLRAFMGQVLANIRGIPGVVDVAFTEGAPLESVPTGVFFQIAGRPTLERAQQPVALFKVVTPSYFHALGLRVRQGRALSDRDRDGAPLAAVINESMARTHFANADPLGQRLLMDARPLGTTELGPPAPWTIVGVIADERLEPLNDRRDQAAVYVANDQMPTASSALVIRASSDPSRLPRALQAAVAAVDASQVVTDIKPFEQLRDEMLAADRLRSWLVGLLAAFALLLAAIGIYGVISYSVVQRTRELGIRAALGASGPSLVRLVAARGLALTAIGLAIGSVAALATARLLRGLLFGVGPSDALTLLGTVGVLAGVAAAACYVPARRAARIAPLDALRAE